MEKALSKIIELRIISLIILLVIGGLAGFLLSQSHNNEAAKSGGYICLGVFLLVALFLVIFSVIKEHYEAVLENERKSNKSVINQLKGVINSMAKTVRIQQKQQQDDITQTTLSVEKTPYEGYEPMSNDTSTTAE